MKNSITKLHHTNPVNPSMVAIYVPITIVHINGINSMNMDNIINPNIPTVSNQSSFILTLLTTHQSLQPHNLFHHHYPKPS